MILKLKVTGITKVTDDRLLVQLQGKHGNSQLNLPISQQSFVKVGDEWVLHSGKALPGAGELDETAEKRESKFSDALLDAATSGLSGEPFSGGLDALAGKPKKA
jgi:hypothetical protein